jgi:hypothetical protein
LTTVKLTAYKISKLRKQKRADEAGDPGKRGQKKIRYLRVEDEYWNQFIELAEKREQLHGNLFRDMLLAFKAGKSQ